MWSDRLRLRASLPGRFLDVDGEARPTMQPLATRGSVRLRSHVIIYRFLPLDKSITGFYITLGNRCIRTVRFC